MRKQILVLLAMSLAACGLDNVTAHFAAMNASPHPIQLVAAGGNIGPVIPPGSPARFDAKVPMPSSQYSATDPVYKLTNLDVFVKDLVTGTTWQTNCQVGENTLTSVTYTIDQYGYTSLRCNNNYNLIPVHRDTLALP